MDNKLAKELKEAGFPFIEMAPKAVAMGDHKAHCVFCGYPMIEINDHLYMMPVLEELIAACGDQFYDLTQHRKDFWLAMARISKINEKSADNKNWYAFAPTPTEAVAKLWLTLNKI